MAGLRKGKCYRRLKRAYTRKSKFKKKGYIKAVPPMKIVKFNMGDLIKKFPNQVDLVSKDAIQIRHNALESARMVINRRLSNQLGNNYHLRVRVYPHHILRENKLLTGAGADRMQSGMQRAFGKAIGISARVKQNQPIFTICVDKKDVAAARGILKGVTARLPCKCGIVEITS